MARVLTPTEIQRLRPLVQAGKRDDANVTLQKIEDIGPTVLENFWILQDANRHMLVGRLASRAGIKKRPSEI